MPQRYQDEFWLAGHKYVKTALDRISETRNVSMMTCIKQGKFLSTTRVYGIRLITLCHNHTRLLVRYRLSGDIFGTFSIFQPHISII